MLVFRSVMAEEAPPLTSIIRGPFAENFTESNATPAPFSIDTAGVSFDSIFEPQN